MATIETHEATIERDDLGDLTDVNEYHFVKALGRGAFAEVSLCTDGAGQHYAIKVFDKSLLRRKRQLIRRSSRSASAGGASPARRGLVISALDQVADEVAVMKRLLHPNLCQLHEVIDDDVEDAMFMVLEYIALGPVMAYDAASNHFAACAALARDGGRAAPGTPGAAVDATRAARCLADIIAGSKYLHLHCIAHRDLKPDNVLLTADFVCKIADFGVAHYFEEDDDEEESSDAEDEAEDVAATGAAAAAAAPTEAGAEGGAGGTAPVRTTLKRQVSRSLRPTLKVSALEHDAHKGQVTKTEGTWAFWAPEMAAPSVSPRPGGEGGGGGGGEGGTPRGFSAYATDLWAAGVVLYVLVAARLPFSGETPTELFDEIARFAEDLEAEQPAAGAAAAPPAAVSRARANLPADVPKGCRRALAGLLRVDPRRRSTVGDVEADPWLRAACSAAGDAAALAGDRAGAPPAAAGHHLFDEAVYAERVVVSDADRAASIKGAEHSRRVAQAIGRCVASTLDRVKQSVQRSPRARAATTRAAAPSEAPTIAEAPTAEDRGGERADQSGEDRGSTPRLPPIAGSSKPAES